MQTTKEALTEWGQDSYGPVTRIEAHVDDVIEVRIEPLLYDDQFYVAVYQNDVLVAPKVVCKPGKISHGRN